MQDHPIDTTSNKDLQFWMEKFGVNRHQLFDAIRHVGTTPEDVDIYLHSGAKPIITDNRFVP